MLLRRSVQVTLETDSRAKAQRRKEGREKACSVDEEPEAQLRPRSYLLLCVFASLRETFLFFSKFAPRMSTDPLTILLLQSTSLRPDLELLMNFGANHQ